MKLLGTIVLMALALGSQAKAASSVYDCDGIDRITGYMIMGSHQTVEISDDGQTASLFATVVYPGAKPELQNTLTLMSPYGAPSFKHEVEDSTVTFSLTSKGSAGVLKTESMPQPGGASGMTIVICEKQ